MNDERPSRATGEIPQQRRQQELSRLRPLRVSPDRLALRIPIQVSVTAEVSYDGRSYAMPPEAASMAGTLYLYQDHVHIVAVRFQARHPCYVARGTVSRQPEHRAAQLAVISGKRGRRYLQREHLLETGEAALLFLTELVHRDPPPGRPEGPPGSDTGRTYMPEFSDAVESVRVSPSRLVRCCLRPDKEPRHSR